MTTLAAQPFDYHFDIAHSALLIIDMQRDFVEPGGFGASLGNDVMRLQAIIPTCAAVLAAWRAAGGLVVHTREGHAADLSDCPAAKRDRGNPTLRIGDAGAMGRLLIVGEPGQAIVPALAPVDGEWVIDKPGKGAFYNTTLGADLQQRAISHLVLMGVTTEVCVQTTMREANDRGYDCLLIEDGTESYFADFKTATLAMITAQGGIVGWVAPAAGLVAALSARSAPAAGAASAASSTSAAPAALGPR